MKEEALKNIEEYFEYFFCCFLPECIEDYNNLVGEPDEYRIMIISKIIPVIKTGVLMVQNCLEVREKILKDDVSDEFLKTFLSSGDFF